MVNPGHLDPVPINLDESQVIEVDLKIRLDLHVDKIPHGIESRWCHDFRSQGYVIVDVFVVVRAPGHPGDRPKPGEQVGVDLPGCIAGDSVDENHAVSRVLEITEIPERPFGYFLGAAKSFGYQVDLSRVPVGKRVFQGDMGRDFLVQW